MMYGLLPDGDETTIQPPRLNCHVINWHFIDIQYYSARESKVGTA